MAIVKNIRLRQAISANNVISYNIIVTLKGDNANVAHNVQVDISPSNGDSPTPNPATVICEFLHYEQVVDKKLFATTVTPLFPGNPLDCEYICTATVKAADGTAVGDTTTRYVMVEDPKDEIGLTPAV